MRSVRANPFDTFKKLFLRIRLKKEGRLEVRELPACTKGLYSGSSKLQFLIRAAVSYTKAKARLRRIHKVRQIKVCFVCISDVFNRAGYRAAAEQLRSHLNCTDFIFRAAPASFIKKLLPALAVQLKVFIMENAAQSRKLVKASKAQTFLTAAAF